MYIHIVPLISGDVYMCRFTCYAQCNDCMIECNSMATENFICYFRVSTKRQGQSGLGLEAQRKSVNDFLAHRDANIIHEFTEVESGRRNNRFQLLEAIELCKSTDSTLLVANISRLTRNAAFLLNLRDSGVKFIAADMPDANNLTIGIMALVAQNEAEQISERTKKALAAAKARGVKLGAYDKNDKSKWVGRIGTRINVLRAGQVRAEKYRDIALEKFKLTIRFDPDGSLSLRQLADKFNDNNIKTISGNGKWSANSIRRLKQLT